MLNPNDLLNTKFEKKMGGYKAADVDSFLVEVASLFAQQKRDIADMKRKLDAAQARLAQYESEQDSLREALLNAQKLADHIVKEAGEKAAEIERAASQRAEQALLSTKDEIVKEQEKLSNIKREVSAFRSKLMNIYRTHIELINDIPSVQEENPAAEASVQRQETPAAAEKQPEPAAAEAQKRADDGVPAPAETRDPAEAEAAAAEAPESLKAGNPEPIAPAGPDQPSDEDDIGGVRLNVRYDEKTGEYVPLTDFSGRSDERGAELHRRKY